MDEDTLLAILVVCLKRKETERKRQKRKRLWMQERYKIRNSTSCAKLWQDLNAACMNDLKNILKIDYDIFEDLLSMIGPLIKKQDTTMREAIPESVRLSTTLHYLATGTYFENLKHSSAISPSAISKIVLETCEAIIFRFKDFMKVSYSEEEWLEIANDFYNNSNFPNCLGAVGAKHIAIDKPKHTGSSYRNYKKFFSIILLAVANSSYEFLMADVDRPGQLSDGAEVLQQTSFLNELLANSLNLPKPYLIPGNKILPYVFVANEEFPLIEHIIKPYPLIGLTEEQLIFNNRLERAQQFVENAFGILSCRFGVLRKPIKLAPEKVHKIVLACCYLHNYLIRKTADYIEEGMVDREDVLTGIWEKGWWRDVIELTPLQNATENSYKEAEEVRNTFKELFNDEVAVIEQNA